jgi:hypothetical protein
MTASVVYTTIGAHESPLSYHPLTRVQPCTHPFVCLPIVFNRSKGVYLWDVGHLGGAGVAGLKVLREAKTHGGAALAKTENFGIMLDRYGA